MHSLRTLFKRKEGASRSTKPGNRLTITIGTIAALTMIIALCGALLACSGSDSDGSSKGGSSSAISAGRAEGPIDPTWITADTAGDVISISKAEVEAAGMTHFKASTQKGDLSFMAYVEQGDIVVRANVCPPCRSVGFSLDGDELVCHSCGTRFEAATGDGISGGCKAYPKASVNYNLNGDDLSMSIDHLITAYENTTESGWP